MKADLLDPLFLSSPSRDDFFARMRQVSPAHWHEPEGEWPGFWSITRYVDIDRLLRSSNLSSVRGNMLETLLSGGDPAGGLMVVVSEGRRHRILRQAIDGLSPQALGSLKASLDQVIRETLSRAYEIGDVIDYVNDIAALIPLHAICELLAVPPADRPHVLAMTRAAIGSENVDQASTAARVARNEIACYCQAGARETRGGRGRSS